MPSRFYDTNETPFEVLTVEEILEAERDPEEETLRSEVDEEFD